MQRALQSVCQQQDVMFEVIITDDSTTNDIESHISSLNDKRIRYFHHRPSLGAVCNWNFGLSQAQGDYVILLHHDEAMGSNNYLKQLQTEFDEGYDVVVSNIKVVVDNCIKPQHFTTAIKRFIFNHPTLLFLANAVGPCACITFRRSQLQTFCDELHWSVDVEWYYRMLLGRKVRYVPQLVIHSIHGHEGQITQQLDIKNTFETDRLIVNRLHSSKPAVRLMLWLYKLLIINVKRLLHKI